MSTNKSCTNCPGATDHDTAHCPLRGGFDHFPELLESVQQMDAMLKAECAQGEREVLPYWEPCNPACDPELNGFRDRQCHCAQASAALAQPSPVPVGNIELARKLFEEMALIADDEKCIHMLSGALAQPSPAPKSDMQRAIESWEELSLGAHLYRCCVGVWNNLLPDEEGMPEYRELRKAMDDWENGQPSPAPEVVAHQHRRIDPEEGPGIWQELGESSVAFVKTCGNREVRELMTVTQHDRIVRALRAERDGAIKLLGQSVWQKIQLLTQERDAAQARVAELEKQEPVAWTWQGTLDALKGYCPEGVTVFNHKGPGVPLPLYAAPVAQAGQAKKWTYASEQETNCAGCGIRKHTPLRVDWMGGYVCLTCIGEKLEELYEALPDAQAGQVPDIDELVGRFLSWKLPDEVCADPCASMPFTPNRFGTNLLNWEQAKEMLNHVLAAAPAQGE